MFDLDEDDTCRRFVLPALKEVAGWPDERIRREFQINDGRIRATTRLFRRDPPLRADYILEYASDLPVAVVEAKRWHKDAADGLEQAKRYARLLDLPFAYATNGREIIEFDFSTGAETVVACFPTPEHLWQRYRAAKGLSSETELATALAPFDQTLRNWDNSAKRPRYYQQVAINRAVRALSRGDRKVLLVMATGTGKTMVAAQIVSKLWTARWPDTRRRPRVLYLADRNILVDQPKDDYFSPMFGDAVHKLSGGDPKTGRNIYFGLYQSLDSGEGAELFYKQFAPDFFDLVIVDECHRGSARDDSQWRQILKYFEPAAQLGLTATPVDEGNADTYAYFGKPIFEYSLANGIEDGFLAPYRVRKIRFNVDLTGWRPAEGQTDIYGNEIPDNLYGPKEYEKVLAILERTEEAARYLTECLQQNDRMGKTIVFCENNDHAARMRAALTNANRDMVQRYPNYVCRITSSDGPHGRVLLDDFRQVDTDEPVIAVTSRLLSTGVDIPTVKNIVLFRRIASMPEFKQIVGRGTRLFPAAEKLTFDIIDFVDATRLFNDPKFDGPPLRVVRDDTDETGHIVDTTSEDLPEEEVVAEPLADYEPQDSWRLDGESPDAPQITDPDEIDRIRARSRRLYVNGVDVFIDGSAHYISAGDGRRLRLVELRQYVRDRVIELDLQPDELRAQWAQARSRRALRERLTKHGVELEELAERVGQPAADTMDLLLHVTWQTPLITRRERVHRLEREHRHFLESFAPEAREILETILDQYATHGEEELNLTVLRAPALAQLGTPTELADRFGGREELREAVDQLSEKIYASA
ncbi:DEAD/DEAH box helicase [Sphaerisporangium album]|uniref:DEAD/DEAH box helicase n=1 Tax=Sphaerisporangium album TaxID=509200 RepID=A0A367FR64_9ACTN|nr:DEAD/DEAH box helicase family protein [Sphaerisporangium album]RCG32399.1 DEAD/DEAH box helicase [Sphaerisporangium album]